MPAHWAAQADNALCGSGSSEFKASVEVPNIIRYQRKHDEESIWLPLTFRCKMINRPTASACGAFPPPKEQRTQYSQKWKLGQIALIVIHKSLLEDDKKSLHRVAMHFLELAASAALSVELMINYLTLDWLRELMHGQNDDCFDWRHFDFRFATIINGVNSSGGNWSKDDRIRSLGTH